MKNHLVLGATLLLLTGCGGGPPPARTPVIYAPAAPTAAGPLANACLASDRSARSRALCGCIQAVANRTLTASEQRRAVGFYTNPQQAQTIRQSDRAADEHFWDAYSAYAEQAEQICR